MTLTELRYIVAVARERHFGRAAESCFVSQPTLSVAVRKLEDELGVQLFERGTGEVATTPVGQSIVDQARRVLEEAAVITRIAHQGQDELDGVLRLGVIYTIGPYLLPWLIPLLRRKAPRMPLQIEENYTGVLAERLRQGELDILILSLPFTRPGVLVEALYEEPFVVLLPKGHRLERETAIDAHQLSYEDLLLLGAGNCFRDQVLEVCPECGRAGSSAESMQKTLEGSSLETIRLMVASGMGVTVLPQTSIRVPTYSEELVSVRPFTEPAPRRTVAMAWRRSFPRPQAVRMLAEAVRDCPLGDEVRMIAA
ncbi:MAG: hydrogen peroxide-inducible genes activator [Gammaproteobacteria bacterium]|nr:hydrogen peroxide-inducible genes activator [Gammaproteobacteria bacterium]MCP5423531.1 hydrogen peroxide-inducible genes activator [Gammaproteobacteria bacterium]